MNCHQIIQEFQSMASEKYKQNVIKLGIPEDCSIGVSTEEVRKLAKKIGKSNQLANELWKTGYHEARLLAVLLFDKKTITLAEVKPLMKDVVSWDLCDHLCKNIIIKIDGYQVLIEEWVTSREQYLKRAAFTLMASAVIHEKNISNHTVNRYLELISEYSDDEREHVKKAVAWALKEIGKKDFNYNEKAILLCNDLKESKNKTEVWIAKTALKELENLVKVEGRGRLISASSQMGKEKN